MAEEPLEVVDPMGVEQGQQEAEGGSHLQQEAQQFGITKQKHI